MLRQTCIWCVPRRGYPAPALLFRAEDDAVPSCACCLSAHLAARVAPQAGLDNFTPNANPQVLVLMGSIPLMSVVLGTVMREKLVTPLERIFAVIESNTSAVFGAPHAPALPMHPRPAGLLAPPHRTPSAAGALAPGRRTDSERETEGEGRESGEDDAMTRWGGFPAILVSITSECLSHSVTPPYAPPTACERCCTPQR